MYILNKIEVCISLDEYLNWSPHINHLSQKFIKFNAMLCKLRNFVSVDTIKSNYYTLFHSHLSYICSAWGKNLNSKTSHKLTTEKRYANN